MNPILSNMKFHVTYRQHKKLLDLDVSSMVTFTESICKKFPQVNTDNIIVQYYLADMHDWVDVDESILEECQQNSMNKIKILDDPEVTNLTVVKHTQKPVPAVPVASLKETEDHTPKKDPGGIWPCFPKEIMGRELLQALDSKKTLTRSQSTQVLDAFYNDAINRNEYYPRSSQYERMTDILLDTYPHLVGKTPLADAKTLWKEKLKYKFQNSRRRHDKDIEICQKRKRKSKPSHCNIPIFRHRSVEEFDDDFSANAKDETKEMVKHENLENSPSCSTYLDSSVTERSECDLVQDTSQYGLQRYIPGARPATETEDTVKAHVQSMKLELKKREINKSKLNTLMDLTFFDRRVYIVTKNPDVSEVLEEYPALKDEEQLQKEFLRLKPKGEFRNISEKLLEGLNKYGSTVVDKVSKKSRPAILTRILSGLKSQTVKENKRYLAASLALLGVPFLLGEEMGQLLWLPQENGSQTQPAFFIECRGDFVDSNDFVVNIEHYQYGTTNFIKAVAILVAGIYAFNLQYNDELRSTWIFIQKFLLGIQDETKTPKKLVRLLSQL